MRTGDVAAKVGDGKETVTKVLRGDLTDIHRFGEAHFKQFCQSQIDPVE